MNNLNKPLSVGCIAGYFACFRDAIQRIIDLSESNIVKRKYLGADQSRIILEPALIVCATGNQSNPEQAAKDVQGSEKFILPDFTGYHAFTHRLPRFPKLKAGGFSCFQGVFYFITAKAFDH